MLCCNLLLHLANYGEMQSATAIVRVEAKYNKLNENFNNLHSALTHMGI